MVSGNPLVILPLLCLTGGAFAVYLIARLLNCRNEQVAALTAGVFFVTLLSLGALQVEVSAERLPIWELSGSSDIFLRADPGMVLLAIVASGLGLLTSLYSARYLAHELRYETYYPLLLLLIAGLVGMLLAADLFNLYMFCELMSVSTYVLVAFRRRTCTAIEAGFKYLIMGSVATIVMLMGVSFIYRERGDLLLPALSNVQAISSLGVWGRAGLGCFLVGLGLKSGIVPLHTWLPDAYGSAPGSISAILSGVVSKSTLYVLLCICLGFGMPASMLGLLLIGGSVLNMVLGNNLALLQTHTKRLLAYSSIAQTGYVMFSLGVGLYYTVPEAIQAAFFVLLAHAMMKGLAFLCAGVCQFRYDASTTLHLRGMVHTSPLIGVAFGAALAGLAGVPPLAGFVGKWFVLRGVVFAQDWLGYVGLAIFLLNSLLGLGYYLPLIGSLLSALFHPPPPEQVCLRLSLWITLPIVILGGLVIAAGIYPGPWMAWTREVSNYLLGIAAR
ncbi:MAG TPA: NADH dehydrogenase [Chloroflexi bacterium]|nr:NADH dehydrogenase [Chloroflexota bacterium]